MCVGRRRAVGVDRPGVDRRAALQGLIRFAFHDADVAHLEIRDRGLTAADLVGLVGSKL